MKRFVLTHTLLATALLSVSCGPPSAIACDTDMDCPEGQVCTVGTNVCGGSADIADGGNPFRPYDAGNQTDSGQDADAGPPTTADAGTSRDAGFIVVDAGLPTDAGPLDDDAGVRVDAGHDGGNRLDAGGPQNVDAGEVDAGTQDAGTQDAGHVLPGERPVASDLEVDCDEGFACTFSLLVDDNDTALADLSVTVQLLAPNITVDVVNGAPEPTVTFSSSLDFLNTVTFSYFVSDAEGPSNTATVTVRVVRRTSCEGLLLSGLDTGDGVYSIDPDGPETGAPAVDMFCDMSNGGWALALKADGRAPTFRYDAPLWTNELGVNPALLDTTLVEAKYAAFWRHGVDEVRVEMTSAAPGPGVTRSAVDLTAINLDVQALSLRELFNRGHVPTDAGRSAWLAMTPNGGLQAFCSAEGFNVQLGPDDDQARTRIGMVANNEDHCNSPDSRIGVGAAGNTCTQNDALTVGNSDASSFCEGSNNDEHAFAFVFVRHDGRLPVVRESCAAHFAAGATDDDYYNLDPDGSGPALAFRAFCNMTVAGGGWLLVGRSHPKGTNRDFGWTSPYGSAEGDDFPFALAPAQRGVAFSEVLTGAWSTGKAFADNIYRWDGLPADFITSNTTNTIDVGGDFSVEGGACNPDSGDGQFMFRHLGFTGRTDTFFMRDNTGADNYGLQPSGYKLLSNCNRGGDLHERQGTLWVR